MQAVIRSMLAWSGPLLAFFVLGPIAAWLTATLRDPAGGTGPSILIHDNGIVGLLALIVAMLVAVAAGLWGAKNVGAKSSLLCAGAVIAWAAWPLGPIDQLARSVAGSGLYTRLLIEGILVFIATVAIGWLLLTKAERWHTTRENPGLLNSPAAHEPIASTTSAGGAAVSLVASLVVVFLMCRTMDKGQAIFSTTLAGLVGAVAGHLAFNRAPAIALLAGVAAGTVVGPVVGIITLSGGGPTEILVAMQRLTSSPLTRPMPMDWAAGALLGVSMGLAWAGSLVDRHLHHERPAEASPAQ